MYLDDPERRELQFENTQILRTGGRVLRLMIVPTPVEEDDWLILDIERSANREGHIRQRYKSYSCKKL